MTGPKSALLSTLFFLSITSLSAPAAGVQIPAPQEVGLQGYTLSRGPVVINRIPGNASGLTFNPESRTLFIILNYPTMVVELNLDLHCKRTVPLAGFNDTEGIAWISGNRFGIVQERRRRLVIVDIPASNNPVNIAGCVSYLVDSAENQDFGVEGLTYSPPDDCFYAVKEKKPKKLYRISLPGPSSTDDSRSKEPVITLPWSAETNSLGMSDLSAVYLHAETGNLLILSDESKCLVECTVTGREISRLTLKSGQSGLTKTIPQPEGITMDNAGNIYICSEPNLMYVFESSRLNRLGIGTKKQIPSCTKKMPSEKIDD